MLDFSHIPKPYPNATVEVFIGSGTAAGQQWTQWTKPRGKGMVDILLIGKGGSGGLGQDAVPQNGGGGGGSGAQTRLRMPLHLLPDSLYISLAGIGAGSAIASYVTIGPKLTAGAGAPAVNDTLMYANGGTNGQDGSGGAGGGAGGTISLVGTMPLGWAYATSLAGQAGGAGGFGADAAAVVLPVTGLLVTGGTGGGGSGNTGAAGWAGGSYTVAGRFPAHPGGIGGSAATTPPTDGTSGYQVIPNLGYWYGGTGGGGVHGSATGAGQYKAPGGNGAPGCGGGGGGCTNFAVGTGGVGGLGGPAICIITCW